MIIAKENVKGKQLDTLLSLKKEIKLRGYSPKTQKAYIDINLRFLDWTKKSPKNVALADVKRYLEHLIDRGVSRSTVSLTINALKFYYQKILRRKFFVEIKHPKKSAKLPVVLSLNEISNVLNSISNVKHRLALCLMYSSGLRVSEVVKLTPQDIDFERKAVHVKGGKGNKDRLSMLAENVRSELENFIKDIPAKNYIFSGPKGRPLTSRSLQLVFARALKKCKIQKPATCHSLRHSFATHLLENNIDIHYIQKLLGHKKLETTQIYTKVSAKNLLDITSPMDLF